MKKRMIWQAGLIVAGSLMCLNNSACTRSGTHTHGPHVNEEEKTAQFTVWTDRYEVFAEHLFLIAGSPTRFITHITDLKTLQPRREGQVKLLLRQGEESIEHVEAAPARTGIYLPELTFPKPGKWQVHWRSKR